MEQSSEYLDNLEELAHRPTYRRDCIQMYQLHFVIKRLSHSLQCDNLRSSFWRGTFSPANHATCLSWYGTSTTRGFDLPILVYVSIRNVCCKHIHEDKIIMARYNRPYVLQCHGNAFRRCSAQQKNEDVNNVRYSRLATALYELYNGGLKTTNYTSGAQEHYLCCPDEELMPVRWNRINSS